MAERRTGMFAAAVGCVRSDPIAVVDLVAALVATPLLAFPNRFSVVALFLLASVWVARIGLRRKSLRRSPSDWPLLFLLLTTLVSLYPSVDLSLSRPKLFGLILGFFVFSLIVEHLRWGARLTFAAGSLLVGGVAVAGLGFVGTDWFGRKLPLVGPLYARLPRLITSVSSSFGTTASGFHPNEIAGMLALILPIAIGIALVAGRRARLLALAAILPMSLVLLLTLSRSAIVGVVIAAGVLIILRWRRLWLLFPIVAAGVVSAVVVLGSGRVLDLLFAIQSSTDVGAKATSRLEVWNRAWLMIQDFPLTGIGLNTFPIIADKLYPMVINGPDARIPHAHDIFLQTAVDLGVPGLIAFVTLLAVAGATVALVWRSTRGWQKGLMAGLGAGLLAHFIFGLTDAVTLGAKPGLLLWIVLGTAIGLGRLERPETVAEPANTFLKAYIVSRSHGVGWLQAAQCLLFVAACAAGATIR